MIASIDLQRVESLVGRSVSLVCFAEFSCYVHFDSGPHLRIEGGAGVHQGGDVWALFPDVQGKALAILGKSLRRVSSNQSYVNLDFEEDLRLMIDVGGPYESLIIEGMK